MNKKVQTDVHHMGDQPLNFAKTLYHKASRYLNASTVITDKHYTNIKRFDVYFLNHAGTKYIS